MEAKPAPKKNTLSFQLDFVHSRRMTKRAKRGNARSPAPLNRVVQPKDERALRGKSVHQELQQEIWA